MLRFANWLLLIRIRFGSSEFLLANLMDTSDKKLIGQIELKMCANPHYLALARQAAQRVAEQAGMPEQDTDCLVLATEEALTNVIRHSYGGPCEKPIIISIRHFASRDEKPSGIEILIRDYGRHVDPKSIKGRDLNDIRPGGLGVHIIKSSMDDIEYSCHPDGGMVLQMIKFIKA